MSAAALAGSFATIVGLLSDFVANRNSATAPEIHEFVSWLTIHGHSDIKNQIEASHVSIVSIKAALKENHETLLTRLSNIDRSLVVLCANQGPLGDLARAFRPDATLSHQAISVLVQFEKAGSGFAFEIESLDATDLAFGDVGGNFRIEDPRFYQDDMETLVGIWIVTPVDQ